MVEKARVGADRQETVTTHLDAANDYADATFGGIPPEALRAFSAAAKALADTLPHGRWPLVDGYLAQPGCPATPSTRPTTGRSSSASCGGACTPRRSSTPA